MAARRRLAAVLWVSLAVPAGVACIAIAPLARLLDASTSGAALVRGWDSWAMASWVFARPPEWKAALAVVLAALAAGWILQLFLTGGILRVLASGDRGPVLGKVASASAALFKPNLWASARYAASLAIWLGGVVGGGAWLLGKAAGDSAPPESLWRLTRDLWVVSAGLPGFFLVSLRFDLARIALARGEAPHARGAYRLAGDRVRGHRTVLLSIGLFWTAVALALASTFTAIGVSMNPRTVGALAALVLFRQGGFAVQAAARIGFWASLLHFDERRRADRASRTIHVADDPVGPPDPVPADVAAPAS